MKTGNVVLTERDCVGQNYLGLILIDTQEVFYPVTSMRSAAYSGGRAESINCSTYPLNVIEPLVIRPLWLLTGYMRQSE